MFLLSKSARGWDASGAGYQLVEMDPKLSHPAAPAVRVPDFCNGAARGDLGAAGSGDRYEWGRVWERSRCLGTPWVTGHSREPPGGEREGLRKARSPEGSRGGAPPLREGSNNRYHPPSRKKQVRKLFERSNVCHKPIDRYILWHSISSPTTSSLHSNMTHYSRFENQTTPDAVPKAKQRLISKVSR